MKIKVAALTLAAAMAVSSAAGAAQEPDYNIHIGSSVSVGINKADIEALINDCISLKDWSDIGCLLKARLPDILTLQYMPEAPDIQDILTADGGNTAEDVTDSRSEANSDIAYEILSLVNSEREANGAASLTLSAELTQMAQYKARDMAEYGFSHDGSYGGFPELVEMFYPDGTAHGENIAMNQRSAEEVMQAWMNSEGHRSNILNSAYTKLGVGYYESGGCIYWVQEFGN